MKLQNKLSALALAAMAIAAAPAQATVFAGDTNRNCSYSDLSGVSVTDCTGFYSGNLLKGNTGDPVDAPVSAALALLGLTSPPTVTYIEKIGSLGGSFTADFTTPLKGITIVGLHFGGGSTAFNGDPKYNGKGGGTSFYKFDAGTSLDSFGLLYSASSGAAIFQTSAVPEPETYALMLAGLGVIGFVARRRRSA